MVHGIIGIAVIIILIIIQNIKNKRKGKKFDKAYFSIDVCIGIIAMLISILITINCYKPEYILTKTQPIESLDVLSGSKGNFILGAGNIKNHITYYYYVKDKEGLYELKSISGENIKLRQEGDENKAYIEVYEPKAKDVILYWMIGNKYIIVVPENTIQKEFNANIK